MKLYHKNPRQITEKQFTDLGGSLSRLGDLGGIVHDLNSDEIIGGNQRSRVFDINQCEIELKEQYLEPDEQGTVGLGFVIWKGKKYAYRQVRWTAKQCEEANIRANKNGGSFDFDTLANEFELDDLLEWGFDKKELDIDLWAGNQPEDPGAQIDKAEELREKWQTAHGQLWILGNHRLLCGDSSKAEDVARLMGNDKADLLLTDPPYGELKIFTEPGKVGKENAAKLTDYGSHYQGEGAFDLEPVLKIAENYCIQMVVWGGNYFTHLLPPRTSWLIWDKRAGEHSWYSDCELAWSNLPIPARLFSFTWQGMIRQGDKEERLHPTQKPVELMDWILRELAKDARVVLDLFSGSGVVLLSCERQSRVCRSMEISPAYVAVTLERWAKATDLQPVYVPDQ